MIRIRHRFIYPQHLIELSIALNSILPSSSRRRLKMSRKVNITLSTCCHTQTANYHTSIFTSACRPPHPPSKRSRSNHYRYQTQAAPRRQYATTQAHATSSSAAGDFPWPEVSTPSAIPTPYQIFQLQEKAPYSKRRFYELVKLYHPDRHAHSCHVPHVDCLSSDAKMKRYRLVVAANDILSDPSRRRAYDLFGAGWSTHPDNGGSARNSDHPTRQRWSGFHDNNSPAGNATWEDWEKWYQRNSRGAQGPVYTSNGGFVSLVAFVVALSAMSQASRVDEHQQYFADRIELVHNDCHENIKRRKNGTKELSDADLAILRFMRSREQGGIPAGCGVSHPDDFKQEGLVSTER